MRPDMLLCSRNYCSGFRIRARTRYEGDSEYRGGGGGGRGGGGGGGGGGVEGGARRAMQGDEVPQPLPETQQQAALPQAAPPSRALLDGGFLSRLADDITTEGVIEALGLFREDAPARIAVMRACLGRDQARLRREAHALAGASRNIGLDRLGHAAAALQHAVEHAEPVPAHVEALALLVDASLGALQDWERSAVALT